MTKRIDYVMEAREEIQDALEPIVGQDIADATAEFLFVRTWGVCDDATLLRLAKALCEMTGQWLDRRIEEGEGNE